ncbi:hypothetical protein K501DRAFT_337910 [Backusella circina FSU 941]|nr:hypothetical protein K501DRAFT_337910 [Backusella circina FSU 941]
MSGEANSYRGGGGQPQYQSHQPNPQEAAQYARQHYGQDDDGDDKSHLFNSVLSKVTGQGGGDESQHHLNETEAEHAAHAHDKIYNQNAGQPAEGQSSRDMGSAAAMQAFKMFSGGGGNSGGGGSSQLVGMAMGEAMKLFNKQGGSQSGANQSEMLQSAAMMAMKLFAAQKGGSGGGGGGSMGAILGMLGSAGGEQKQSGGGAMSLLSKFL